MFWDSGVASSVHVGLLAHPQDPVPGCLSAARLLCGVGSSLRHRTGTGWLTAGARAGGRLDDPDDWVRDEIGTALDSGL